MTHLDLEASLANSSIIHRSRYWSRVQPDKVACLFLTEQGAEGARLTYQDLERRARAIAALLCLKSTPGDRALLLYPSGLEFVEALLGCFYAGIVAVPVYPPRLNRSSARLKAIVRDARPTLGLTTASLLSKLRSRPSSEPELIGLPCFATDEIQDRLEPTCREPVIEPDTLAFLQYTSGSTALPKGVMVTHGNLLHNEQVIQEVFRQTRDSVVVGWLPLYHDMGLIGTVLQPLFAGATCVLMSPMAFLQKPVRWLEVISQFGATSSGGPNFAYELCVEKIPPDQRTHLDLSRWEVAFNGAEPIRPSTLERFTKAFEPCGFRRESFSPCYGLAEATLLVTGHSRPSEHTLLSVRAAALEEGRVQPNPSGERGGRTLVSCGHTVAGQKLLIIDPETGKECASDQVGEIWVAGPSVGQGYWGRPAETERAFRGFLAGGQGPFLRTGDLGFLWQGELFVTGRLKDLIIIRGRNLSPQDIELTAERSHPELRAGCGAAFSAEIDGEERLIVLHELERRHREDTAVIVEALRRSVAEEHQVQVYEVVLLKPGSIPKTSSGKLQRHACRAAYLGSTLQVLGRSALERAFTDTGERLVRLSREALTALNTADRHSALLSLLHERVAALAGSRGRPPLIGQALVGLGLDSLSAVELKLWIEDAFGVSVPLPELLESPGTEELCATILAGLEEGQPLFQEPFASSFMDGDQALSNGQKALWFLERFAPKDGVYNIAVAALVRSGLKPEALRRALQRLILRHSILRTTFHDVDGSPVQRVSKSAAVDFEEEDASNWEKARLAERLGEEAYRPFDLAGMPPLRVRLFEKASGGHVLLLAIHHIITDFWSLAVLRRELGALYREETGGPAAELPSAPPHYGQFVKWQEEMLAGPRGEQLWTYWSEQLAGPPPDLDLSTDRPRLAMTTHRGGARAVAIPRELALRFEALGRLHGATLFAALLALWKLQLGRYTEQEDFTIGSPMSGRSTSELAGLLGYVVNPVVLRANLAGDPTFAELLARVRKTVLAALGNSDFPLTFLIERLDPVRDPIRSPLFQSMLVMQPEHPGEAGLSAFALGEAGARIELGGVTLESLRLEERRAQFDLTLRLAKVDEGLSAVLEYDAELFDGSTAARMLEHFRTLLGAVVTDPDRRISTLPLLTEAEREEVLQDWNDTDAGFPRGICLHQLFEAQVERTPEAEALVVGELRLTYRELNARSNRLAHQLRSLGVRPEVLVGVACRRTPSMVVSLLAVLKSGGAYVPLDLSYPRERLEFLLEDSRAHLLILEGGRYCGLESEASRRQVIDLDEAHVAIAARDDANPEPWGAAGNLAYLIYTSGSTGKPKAVAIEHRSPVAMLHWAREVFGLQELSGVLFSTSISFDLSIFELFVPLAWGGRVILAGNALELPSLPAASEVTLINTVPSAMAALLRDARLPDSVCTINLAGEAVGPELLHAAQGLPSVRRIFNLYGPSEDTTYSTFASIEQWVEGSPPIGRPIAGTRIYLLSLKGEPVSLGIPGEVYLAGEGLARGYLDRPELTAASFLPDPFSEKPGARLYRTGDRARYRTDGKLSFLGRIDHQVKVRGFRVELGEIEVALDQHPAVHQSVVLPCAPALEGDVQLVAYLVAEERQPAHGELRSFLKDRLPSFMVPQIFVALDSFPLTPNGKVDRRRLPAPLSERSERESGPAVSLLPVEEIVTGIWAEVLSLTRVGLHDNFFDLGGHSLLAARVTSRLSHALGVDVPLTDLFGSPTPALLARSLEERLSTGVRSGAMPIRPVIWNGDPPLSFAQERLWFLDRFQPGSGYKMLQALAVHGELRIPLLQAALTEVVRRHEVLRTAFIEREGELVQVITPSEGWELDLPLVDLTALPAEVDVGTGSRRYREVRRLIAAEASWPFDLAQEPLLRAAVLKLGYREQVLLLDMHHIVSDGWSSGILARETAALYSRGCASGSAPLPELAIQYSDFAIWQREWLRGEVLERQLAYWREQLSGAPPIELPTDRPRRAAQSLRGASLRFTISSNLGVELLKVSRRHGVTLFMTLFAFFTALLRRYTTQEDLLVGTPVAGRNHLETEPLIGLFVNSLVLRQDLTGDPSLSELLARVRRTALGAYGHQDLPFEKLVEELRPDRHLALHPLFQVLFALQDAPLDGVQFAGLSLVPLDIDVPAAKFDLSLICTVSGEELKVQIEYSTALFDAATIERIGHHWHTLLAGGVADLDHRLGDLPLLAEEEYQQLLVEWNGVREAEPVRACIQDRWEEQVERAPDEVAAVFEDERLTYRELDGRANQLAQHLTGLGVGPEVLVGIYLERSIELVIGILGVLKAGGGYLPVDPSYPVARLAFMLNDAGAKVLLTQKHLSEKIPSSGVHVICVDSERTAIEQRSRQKPARTVSPENIAYSVYTSGSTGRPKGVLVTHANAVRLFEATRLLFQFGATDVWTLFHSYAFDFSVWEIWGALLHGGRLVVVPSWVSRSPESFLRLLRQEKVTVLNQTPSAFRHLDQAIASVCMSQSDLSLRWIIFGGEALDPRDLRLWLDRPGADDLRLVNMYGISETTVHVTYRLLSAADLREAVGSPIGRPIPDLQIYVSDSRLQPVPLGVVGEMYVGGAGLARGYLKRPDLTAERFLPDPGGQGGRLYRTGDLARYQPNGDLEYLGRADQQIKIRGFRIELGEIENILRRHLDVSEVVVVARDLPAGRVLVAYVVAASEATPGSAELRSFLKERLPDYMVPSAFVMLERLPLNSNGKLDRRALLLTEPKALPQEEYLAPRTPVQELLTNIWASVLKLDRFSVTDDFFELGGHSLLAAQVTSRLRRVFGVELPLRVLFESPTVTELSELVESALRDRAGSQSPPIERVPRGSRLDLSFAQQRLWFIDQMEPGNSLYNIPIALRMTGRLSVTSLQRSFAEIERRHEVLRTTFSVVDGVPSQEIQPVGLSALRVLDLSGLAPERREALALTLASEEARRPFDLGQGPLLRTALVRLDESAHVALITMHHAVSDGWSIGILVREVAILYQAFSGCEPSPLPELVVQYADFSAWQRQWLQGEVLERGVAYWRRQLDGAPALLELPTDHPRPARQSSRGAVRTLRWPGLKLQEIEAFSRRQGVTLFMSLLAGFQTLLSRYSGQSDVSVGTPVAGRNRVELEEMIGCFVNTLVLHTSLGGDPEFRELLTRVKVVSLAAHSYQEVPFEKLVEELEPERSLAYSPLFQVMFALQDATWEELRLADLQVELLEVERGVATFDLTLSLMKGRSELTGFFEFSPDLFEPATIERMAQHFQVLVEGAMANPGRRLSQLSLLAEAERHQLLGEWAYTRSDVPEDLCAHQLFELQVERGPDAVALTCGVERLTYGELNRRANRLARHLRDLGVGREICVGIHLERGPQMIIALLAVLKAGGAYLPLDPAYPSARLVLMLADARTPVLLTEERLLGSLPTTKGRVVCIDRERERIALRSGNNLAGVASPENLAYVMYTSGSSGRPKGVVIAHRSLVWYARVATLNYKLRPTDRVLQLASISFDISVEEIFPCLNCGASLVLATRALPLSAMDYLAECREQEVTVLSPATAFWHEVCLEVHLVPFPPSIRLVCLGGEKALVERVKAWWRHVGVSVELLNSYGPTETTVVATLYRIDGERESGFSEIPIGRPIAGARIYIVDQSLAALPMGVTGEILIGGSGLARGYLNRPELTAEKFIPNPFSEVTGGRVYRTGDLARWHSRGELEFLGRTDQQVKIRGFRVEPGEIESVLMTHPQLQEALVLIAEKPPVGKRLVAYVVPVPGLPVVLPQLQEFLRQRMPDYMVPSIVVLEAFPRTPNGKVDRKALPNPGILPSETERAVAPRNPVEDLVAEIWSDLLGMEHVSIDDNFFELGGHSLLATRLISRLRSVFQVELPLREIFERPTVAELAWAIEAATRESLVYAPFSAIEPVSREQELPASFAQQRLWFIHQLEPDSPAYNLWIPLRVRGALDTTILGRSLDEIARRHEALRTTLKSVAGRPIQVIHPASGRGLPLVDLTEVPAVARKEESFRLAIEEARRPFNLVRDTLLRVYLIQLDPEEHVLLITLHHVVGDGWSIQVFLRELAMLYAAFLQGRPSPLAELPIQYADFSVWQRNWLQGEVLDSQLSYWRRQLGGALEVLELPIDHPRPVVQSYRGAREVFELPASLSLSLQTLCRREEVTLFMTLLAAFQVLLHGYTGQCDISLGTMIAGRHHPGLEEMIGFFANTLVIRTDLTGNPCFCDVLARSRETSLDAYMHQDLPFERLVDELRIERDLSRTPLFQVVFTLENASHEDLVFPGLDLEPLPLAGGTAQFDLTLSLTSSRSELSGLFDFNRDLFDRPTIGRLARHLRILLEAIAADPRLPIAQLSLLSQAERHQLLVEWSAGPGPLPPESCIHELFEAAAEQSPDAVALAFEERNLTYRELDLQANRLANHLRSLGVGPEVLVGLCMNRSPEMIVGVLGILKAGGAYVPLDPGYPRERLAFILEETLMPVLVGEERLVEDLPVSGMTQIVLLDADQKVIASRSEARPAIGVKPDNLAYVMYTSGSTGRPKGVGVVHRGVVRLVRGTGHAQLGCGEVFLQLAPISFDASTLEIWGALANGGRLAISGHRSVALEELSETIVRYGVTTLWLTAGLFHEMTESQLTGLSPVRQLLAGGDVLSPTHVRKALAGLPGCRLINGYGPTENTTFTACHSMSDPGQVGSSVPLGRPIAHTQVYVLDGHGRLVPMGVFGELFVAGDGLARGYLNRPDLTAERWNPDGVSGRSGERLYRTGDRVRWLPSGVLDFLGRFDHQVKIRGFRIELAEIEAVLSADPRVQQAIVAVHHGLPGDKRLVAYVVPESGRAISALELRESLQKHLPEYMIPSSFAVMKELPLTSNGKIDRKALPAPETLRVDSRLPFMASHSPVEEVVASIWSNVLGVERVGTADNFFELGGHSLLATRVVSHLRSAFHIELGLHEIFEEPTVAGLAKRVVQTVQAKAGVTAPPLTPARRDQKMTLSFAQQRLWFIDQFEPGSPLYNIPVALQVVGQLNTAVLALALSEIVLRHEVLRTVFVAVDGIPQQVILPGAPIDIPIVDLSGLSSIQRRTVALSLTAAEPLRPFDLGRAPLLRAVCLRLADEESFVLITMHHIVSDGWSMSILVREAVTLYEAFAAGRPSPLPALSIQYADFADWQRKWLQGEILERELAYWRRNLAGAAPVLRLSTDRARPAIKSVRGGMRALRLPKALTQGLHALSQRQGTTLFMTMLAGFQALLARYSGQSDVSVGSPIAGRNHMELENLIGFFVNTLVLRADLSDAPRFADLLAQVRELSIAAYLHQDVPFERLVEDLQPERDLAHSPMFQVMFVLQNVPGAIPEISGLTITPIEPPTTLAKFDLTLTVSERGGDLGGTLEYNNDLFDAPTIDRMNGHFIRLLEGVVECPELRVSMLPLLSSAEQNQIAVEWSDTCSSPGVEGCIHEIFEVQAGKTPERVAVTFGDERLDFGELNRRANRLARHLRGLGVGPEARVALFMERSLELIVGLLAILKAGGAYVVLDTRQPAQRSILMLQDLVPAAVLTQGAVGAYLPACDAPVVWLDREWEAISAASAQNLVLPFSSDSLAYIVYTSGSTGAPKGTLIQHCSVINLLEALESALPSATRALRVTLNAPLFFDSSVKQWIQLLRGHTLCMVPEEIRLDGNALCSFLEREKVDVFECTPSQLRVLFESGFGTDGDRTPGRVLIGGEAIDRALWDRLLAHGNVNFYNVYGPSECTVDSSISPVTPAAPLPTIGRPIANVGLYVLHQEYELSPVGIAGELHVAGIGLARGYLNRPDLTAERFVPEPFSGTPGMRLYRTGDLVRWLPAGSLEFLGRVDSQVKVRGFRVELGEIEAVLVRCPQVSEGVVLALGDLPGNQRLVAYVAPAGEIVVSEVRQFLRDRLPEYMIPSAVMILDALPLTPSGKVDRRALPQPDGLRPGLEGSYVAPLGLVEETLAQIYMDVLGLDRIGMHDNFFELGGDSILGIQIVARANQKGIGLTPKHLFLHQTLSELAVVADTSRLIEVDQAPVTGPVPLTPVQHRFFEQNLPEPHHYNHAVILQLSPDCNPRLLEQALTYLPLHHDALRLRFVCEGNDWHQFSSAPDAAWAVTWLDLSSLPREHHSAALEMASATVQASLELAKGPLLRAVLFQSGRNIPARLLVVIHHLVVDGVSWRILFEDLEAAYRQLSRGEPIELPRKTTSFKDWSRHILEFTRADGFAQEWDHWLAREAVPALPVDVPHNANTILSARAVSCSLDEAETTALLHEVPKSKRTQTEEVLITGVALALGRWAGSSFVLIDLERHGRQDLFLDLDTSRTVGWFTTVTPIRLSLAGALDPAESLRAVREQLRAVPNGGLGYGALLYLSDDPIRQDRLRGLQKAEVVFNYLGQLDRVLAEDTLFRLAEDPGGSERSQRGPRAYLLEFNCGVQGGRLEINCTYSENLHRRCSIEDLIQDIINEVRSLIAHCQNSQGVQYSPADFPQMNFSQEDLDGLLPDLGAIEDVQ